MKSITREALIRQLENHRQDIIDDTRRLIAFQSVADRTDEVAAALDFVLSRAREMGMTTGITKEGDAGWAEIGQGKETMGILTHVDVVYPGDLSQWPQSPYDGVLTQDNVLHGRGVVDDKGPVVMCLYIMLSLLELEVVLGRRIRLIVGTTEEGCVWEDMAHYIQQFGAPEMSFSPDGDFPIYYSEKGYCDVNLTFPESGYLNNLLEAVSGESPNSIPSHARISLQNGTQKEFAGTAFHSSMPQCGDNALLKLAQDPAVADYDFARFLRDVFTDEHAPGLALDDGNDTVGGIYVGRTVASPTILRRKENGIWLNVNVRVRYGVTRRELEDSFTRLGEQYHYKYSIRTFTPPMVVDYRQDFISKMNEVYESYGYTGDYMVADGASYAAAFPNSVCWGPILPGDLSCAHMEDEHLPMESFMRACAIYGEYLVEVCEEGSAIK